ncbi:hypothetical protein PROFUN_13933 [Planoprotostelium fungivorum]|uniref:Uncharacterized protein n=1 Tax=Planoprotostelium fungivorum TaxID=1890364 RepID=A0A2P6N2G4_9EUKA|nr:hypothetical protein PROFUN_13933 [Planoprotostelium fungivorum]
MVYHTGHKNNAQGRWYRGGQTGSNPHHPDSVRCTRCPDSAKI